MTWLLNLKVDIEVKKEVLSKLNEQLTEVELDVLFSFDNNKKSLLNIFISNGVSLGDELTLSILNQLSDAKFYNLICNETYDSDLNILSHLSIYNPLEFFKLIKSLGISKKIQIKKIDLPVFLRIVFHKYFFENHEVIKTEAKLL